MKEVADRASGPLSEPTPQAIVDKQNILIDSQGKETATVSAASEWAQAVDEKLEPPQVIVEPKLSLVCTQLDGRSPSVAPVASGEQMLLREDQKPGFCEDFSHRDRDIKRNPVSQGRRDPGNGSARSPLSISFSPDEGKRCQRKILLGFLEIEPVPPERLSAFLSGFANNSGKDVAGTAIAQLGAISWMKKVNLPPRSPPKNWRCTF